MEYTVAYLERILARMASSQDAPDPLLVKRLFYHLRPGTFEANERATTHFADLLGLVERNPSLAQGLRFHLLGLLQVKNVGSLLRDSGILPDRTFGVELWRRLRFKMLPPAPTPDSLRDWMDEMLAPGDAEWIASLSPTLWQRLFAALDLANIDEAMATSLKANLIDAINGLSHRIASAGLDPELLRIEPTLEAYASPFLAQHEEIAALLAHYRDPTQPHLDSSQAMVILDQCEDVLERIRRRSVSVGTSVNLTLQSARLQQQMARVRQLLKLLEADTALHRADLLTQLWLTLSAASGERYNVSNLMSATTGRLAYQVTQHAGQTGQHYIADNGHELRNMFLSAAGGGIIIACMALLKVLIVKAHLVPFQEALLISLNYALGFIVIFVLHFSVATKQPAMTASLMAHTIARARSDAHENRILESFVTSVYASQFAAIAGNLLLAFTTAALLASGLSYYLGVQPVDALKAQKLLAEINLAVPMNLFYAAVAAVGLFLSGIVSGYYDNKCVYERIPERLARLSWPARLISQRGWHGLVQYIGGHLGGLAGNAFFGFYLGMVAAFGALSGLPLDIRHIAFSSANFAYGWQALGWQLPWLTIVLSATGVLMIGMMNLTVSFALAFYLALRAANLSRKEALPLLKRTMLAMLIAPWLMFKLRGKEPTLE